MIRFQAPQLPSPSRVARYYEAAEQSRWYSNGGPCHEALSERLERYVGNDVACVPVANATLGLMVALRAVTGQAPTRRLVIMPSFTFVAVVNAVLWAGLQPLFVDVEEGSWHLDVERLEHALDRCAGRVAAVLAASTFGTPPALAHREGWEALARRARVPLVVDSAAGFGAVDELGRPLGHQGDVEIFSFHATKPFAIGEGGAIITTDRSLARRCAALTNFGLRGGTVEEEAGLNAKLAEWPAATALAVLDDYAQIIDSRRSRAERMLAGLESLGYVRQAGSERSVWQFVSVLAPSAEIKESALILARRHEIELRTYFSLPLHRTPAFSDHAVIGGMDRTDDLATRILSLPMANDLPDSSIDAIVACLAAALATSVGSIS